MANLKVAYTKLNAYHSDEQHQKWIPKNISKEDKGPQVEESKSTAISSTNC